MRLCDINNGEQAATDGAPDFTKVDQKASSTSDTDDGSNSGVAVALSIVAILIAGAIVAGVLYRQKQEKVLSGENALCQSSKIPVVMNKLATDDFNFAASILG